MITTESPSFSKKAYEEQSKRLFQKQKNYFESGATKSVQFRLDMLKKLKEQIQLYEHHITAAIAKDFRKSELETFATEVGIVIDEIDYARKNLKKWAKTKSVRSSLLNFPSRDFIQPEPYGVTLVIGAWNYPFTLTVQPIIGAIAAGNCVILKPSELSPNTSAIIHRMMKEAFDQEYIGVFEGGVEANQALLDLPFNKIFFTGSTRVGKIIMESASKHLTPVTLELGGKSPAIVDESANLEVAASRIAWGKFLNAGQTCVAPDYILVQNSVKDDLLEKLKRKITEYYGENPKNSTDFPRIINDNHFERIANFLDNGEVVCGANADPDERYIAPTILDQVSWEAPVMQEEIFGPVLPVLTFDKIEEVPELIRKNPTPLALYLFTSRKATEKLILQNVSFGGGCINDTVSHLANVHLPFGGVGSSGMGNYHGKAGFDTFTHYKSVMKRGTWLDIPLRYPPYSSDKLTWIKRLFKIA